MFKDITIHRLDCASADERYVAVSGNKYFEVNALTASLLSALSTCESRVEAINRFLEDHDNYSYDQINDIIDQTLAPKLASAQQPARQFLYERQLVPSSWLDKMTDRLAVLFNPFMMIPTFVVAVAAIVCFFTLTEGVLTFSNRVDAITLIGLIGFVFGSSMWHELGHASAIKYYGLHHGAIGFGLYLNFPVLYTDVTAAWLLPRRQRCVVNIAGVYFQCFILIGVIAGFFATGSETLRYMALAIILGFVLTLNPFFKFDGYWLATDILGVVNLRQRTQRLIGYWLRRLVGRDGERPEFLDGLNRGMRMAVVAYAVAVNVFMLYYFCYIIPMFIRSFVEKFPDELMRLIVCLSNNIMPPMALLRNLGSQLLFMILIGYLFYRFIVGNYYKYFAKST